MPIIADAGLGPLFDVLVPIIFLCSAVIIVMLEAAVLYSMKWKSFGYSIGDSLVMNIISTIAGIIIFRNSFPTRWADRLLLLLMTFAVTVIIEGLWLVLNRKSNTIARALLVAFAANLASYSLLALIMQQFAFAFIAVALLLAIILVNSNKLASEQDKAAAGKSEIQ